MRQEASKVKAISYLVMLVLSSVGVGCHGGEGVPVPLLGTSLFQLSSLSQLSDEKNSLSKRLGFFCLQRKTPTNTLYPPFYSVINLEFKNVFQYDVLISLWTGRYDIYPHTQL